MTTARRPLVGLVAAVLALAVALPGPVSALSVAHPVAASTAQAVHAPSVNGARPGGWMYV